MRRKKPEKLKQIEEWLRSYHRIKKEIELDQAFLMDEPLSGISYEGISTGKTNKVVSPTEVKVMMRLKRQERLNTNKELIANLDGGMSLLSAEDRQIIECYYIEGYSWINITQQVNLSESHARRKRNEALAVMQEYIFLEKYDYAGGYSQQALSC